MENNITPASPRKEVQVTFPDGQTFNGPKGTTVEAFILAGLPANGSRPVATLINGRLRELATRLEGDVTIVPVTMADSDGVRIYRRSLSFLMIAAAAEVFPRDTITVHHSMPFGGY
jgi:uridine kinase